MQKCLIKSMVFLYFIKLYSHHCICKSIIVFMFTHRMRTAIIWWMNHKHTLLPWSWFQMSIYPCVTCLKFLIWPGQNMVPTMMIPHISLCKYGLIPTFLLTLHLAQFWNNWTIQLQHHHLLHPKFNKFSRGWRF